MVGCLHVGNDGYFKSNISNQKTPFSYSYLATVKHERDKCVRGCALLRSLIIVVHDSQQK